jgi:hypothetical protein
MCQAQRCPPTAATCRCREPKVDKARPRLCYECGLPVPRHSDAQLDAIVDKVRRA